MYNKLNMINELEVIRNSPYYDCINTDGEISIDKNSMENEDFKELINAINYVNENLPTLYDIAKGVLDTTPIVHYSEFDFIYDVCPRLETVKAFHILYPEDMTKDMILSIYNNMVGFIKQQIFGCKSDFESLIDDCKDYLHASSDFNDEFMYKTIRKNFDINLPEEYDSYYLNNTDLLSWILTISNHYKNMYKEECVNVRAEKDMLEKENRSLKIDNDDLKNLNKESNKGIQYEEDLNAKFEKKQEELMKMNADLEKEVKDLQTDLEKDLTRLFDKITNLKNWMYFFIGTTIGFAGYAMYLAFFVK